MSFADKIKDYLKRDETSEMSIHTDSFTLFLGKYPPEKSQLSRVEAQRKVGSLVDGTQTSSSEHIDQEKTNESLLLELKSLAGKKIKEPPYQYTKSTSESTSESASESASESHHDSDRLRLPIALDVKHQGGGPEFYHFNYHSDSDISVSSLSSVDL